MTLIEKLQATALVLGLLIAAGCIVWNECKNIAFKKRIKELKAKVERQEQLRDHGHVNYVMIGRGMRSYFCGKCGKPGFVKLFDELCDGEIKSDCQITLAECPNPFAPEQKTWCTTHGVYTENHLVCKHGTVKESA